MGPLDASIAWSEEGLEGSRKFLDRVYRLLNTKELVTENSGALDKVYHETVKFVTEQLERSSSLTRFGRPTHLCQRSQQGRKLYVEYAKAAIHC